MMCPKCGKENEDNSKFCNQCGEKLTITKQNCQIEEIEDVMYASSNIDKETTEENSIEVNKNIKEVVENNQEIKDKKTKRVFVLNKKKFAILFCGIFIIVLCISLIPYYKNKQINKQFNNHITKAQEFLNKKDYDNAKKEVDIIKSIGVTNDKNLNEMVQKLSKRNAMKSYYDKGLDDLKQKSYYSAVVCLDGLDKNYLTDTEWKDSQDKLIIAKQELLKSTKDEVNKLSSEGKYDQALYALTYNNAKLNDNELNNISINLQSKKDEQEKQQAKEQEEQASIQAKKSEENRKAKAKQEGVKIGMAKKEVLESSWGNPDEINKTTTAFGVSEQWVYGINSSRMNFLYFENGILTSVQN